MGMRCRSRLGMLACALAGLTGLARPADAAVRYVNAAASGANTGSDWANAFTSLQSALALAAAGDEIWIAEGTYRPTARTTPNDLRSATFAVPGDVTVYGGFAGHETSPSQRQVAAHPTILSGDLLSNDPANLADNAYHVVTCQPAAGTTTTLDGLTIRAGRATNAAFSGAAIYHADNRLALVDCTVTDNVSTHSGAIYSNAGQGVTLTRCIFSKNTASTYGAALYLRDGPLSAQDCLFQGNSAGGQAAVSVYGAPATISRCRFENNRATNNHGGAFYCEQDVQVTECTFTGNTAVGIGGAFLSCPGAPGEMNILRCVFQGNQAQGEEMDGGGAVNCGHLRLRIADSVFLGNSAYNAGALRVSFTTADLVNCRFEGNTAVRSGGAVYNRMSSVLMANCLISGNSAGFAAAARNSDSTVTMANCTVIGNTGQFDAAITTDQGNSTSVVNVVNSILWGNRLGTSSGEDAQLTVGPGCTIQCARTCVQGWTGTLPGEGNVGTDPLLDPTGRLQPASPCIDAGDKLLLPPDTLDLDGDLDTAEQLPLDLDRAARLINAPQAPDLGPGTPPHVDLGAFEYIEDCNANWVFDACELTCGQLGGACDVDGCGTAQDCDQDATPDSCENDSEQDGLIDDCDDDDDNDSRADTLDNCPLNANPDQADADADSAGDACDACPNTLPGLPVHTNGCPITVTGDMDSDGDVDQEDFGVFQCCLSGQVKPGCEKALLDADNDVDSADTDIFLNCLSGPNVPAKPSCLR